MTLISHSGVDALANSKAQVCVVGSGPVGLALARDIAHRGCSVILVESGLMSPSASKTALSDATLVTPSRHAAPTSVICRAFGGTSRLWGGRCVPFDPLDFSDRPYIEESKWPITEHDIEPFYQKAAQFLDCGGARFQLMDGQIESLRHFGSNEIEMHGLERWCSEPLLNLRLRDSEWPSNLMVVTDVTVVDLKLAEGIVQAITLVDRQKRIRFDGAELFVLACGGLETARLLLVLQMQFPSLFGGESSPLGRYYMGHLSGHEVAIQFDNPKFAEHFRYRDEGRAVSRARIALSAEMQRRHRLPNVVFWPTNPTMSDPGHGSGLLSLLFVILSTPGIGNHFISEPIRQMQMSKKPRFFSHFKNIAFDLPETVMQSTGLLWQKLAKKRRKPFFFLHSADGKYLLHYHGEHSPNRESRVYLSDEYDELGVPRLTIDLRFSPNDADGIARTHFLLDEILRSARIGRLLLDIDDEGLESLTNSVFQGASDGYSQIGLTRMGVDATDGVVDSDCKVFGVKNLFIAGSSVFRTSGHANPTFPAVALGLRLANHIDQLLSSAEHSGTR